MTSYRNKYLEMLKTDFGKKPLPDEPPKLTKPNSVSFVSSQDRPVSAFSPPYDAEGTPLRCLPELWPGGVLALAQIP